MTIRYNPNGGYKGTGGWYEDEEEIVVEEEINWYPVVLITIASLITAFFMSI